MAFPGIGKTGPGHTSLSFWMNSSLSSSRHQYFNPTGLAPHVSGRDYALSGKEIVRAIWDAQGYGNLAVCDDGTIRIVEPGQVPVKYGLPPLAVF
jgi:hypothetical protein